MDCGRSHHRFVRKNLCLIIMQSFCAFTWSKKGIQLRIMLTIFIMSIYISVSAVAAGTIAAGQSQDLVLSYDITQSGFQTLLQASVLITTSGRPSAKVRSKP